MKQFILGALVLLVTGCSSPTYKNGQKFTFDAKEMESRLTYFCRDKPGLEPAKIRAQKAHAYFVKQNDINTELLLNDMMKKVPSDKAMEKFMSRTENIATSLHKKFSCLLIDTEDY